MKIYSVYDTDLPAILNGGEPWHNHHFLTFEEALTYARKWIGPMFGGSDDGKNGIILKVNEPWDYGYGSIEIKERESGDEK